MLYVISSRNQRFGAVKERSALGFSPGFVTTAVDFFYQSRALREHGGDQSYAE